MPMLPNSAMPMAPPNSAQVSEIDDAAPARSGGAVPTIRSLVSVKPGAKPNEKRNEPTANQRKVVCSSITVNMAKPTADMTKPMTMSVGALTRRTTRGVISDPTTKESAQGSVQRPD